MFNLLNIPIQLPPELEFLADTPLKAAILTVVAWIVLAGLGYLVVFVLAHRLARRTETEVDDVLLRASRGPFLVLAAVLGVRDAVDLFRMQVESVAAVQTWLDIVVIGNVAYWLWRVVQDIVLYYGAELAERSETSVDDVLLPAARQIAPIVILGAALAVALQRLGIDPAGIIVAIGGVTFIAAFALQDSLSNIFGGLSLVVDTPFSYGDLVMLDNDVYVIQKIGLRVTELYSADRHMIVLMPNSKMANERLVNITRPTPALMTPITVRTTHAADPRQVIDLLKRVADAHPNILGRIAVKLDAMSDRVESLAGEGRLAEARPLVKEMARLVVEDGVNRSLETLTDSLDALAATMESMESGGFSPDQRAAIQAALDGTARHLSELKRTVTLWLLLMRHARAVDHIEPGRTLAELQAQTDRYQHACEAMLRAGEITLIGDIPIHRKENMALVRALDSIVHRRGLGDLDSGLPDIDEHADFSEVVKSWNRRMARLEGLFGALNHALATGEERRLDDMARNLRDYVYTGLKETTPEWKYPQVNLTSFEVGLEFTLEAFVDDVRREHYERHERVETELRRDIVTTLRQADIELSPWPRSFVLPT